MIVTTSKDGVQQKNGDMWDSGIVQSQSSIEIKYKGKPLHSAKTYYWNVTAISKKGEIAESDIASFGMGILKLSDWRCGFIGVNIEPYVEKRHDRGDKVGLPSPYFRKSFTISPKVISAKIFSTAYGVYELRLNGKKVGEEELAPLWTNYNESLQYQCYDVTSEIVQGENVLGAILGDGWYTGNIACVGRKQYGDYPLAIKAQMVIKYEDKTMGYVISDKSWEGFNRSYPLF